MDNLAEKESITIRPPARCARHDITLPGHIMTNVITLGNMFQLLGNVVISKKNPTHTQDHGDA